MRAYRGKNVFIGAWHYVGLDLLFSIPVLGWILALVASFNHEKENRLHYARSFFARTLVVLLIVGIYAAIVYFTKGEAYFNMKLDTIMKKGEEFINAFALNKVGK